MSAVTAKWPLTRLGDICEFKYGKSLPETARAGGDISVFGSNGVVGAHNSALTEGPTIVIGRKGSHGEVNFSPASCWPIDTTYYVDRSATKADIRWLFHRLCGAGLNQMNRAAAVPGLNREDAYRVEILLPPLEEQRRIAAILDQAETLRTQRRTALALLDSLTQSLFLDMFGDPLIESSGKPFYTLGTVCEKISDGTHHSPAIQLNGVPYITARHLKAYGLDFHADPWFVSMEDHQTIYSRCDPKPNDVLYIKDGATTGLAAINNYDFEFSMLSSLALLRPNKKLISACYLCHWLNNNEVRKKLIGEMAGAAIRRLTLSKIKAFRLPVPPLPLQQPFATRIASIEALKATTAAPWPRWMRCLPRCSSGRLRGSFERKRPARTIDHRPLSGALGS